MLYIFIDTKQLKFLFLKKTLLGQYEPDVFEKKHEIELVHEGTITNIDLLASAIKEGIGSIQAQGKQKEITLILPQVVFQFLRADVPKDIAPSALNSFIRDKARSSLTVDLDQCVSECFIKEHDNQKLISFYALPKELLQKYQETFALLDLKVITIIPESLVYFKLFEKTLRKEKKETIFYIHHEAQTVRGYLYDSLGLLHHEVWMQPIPDESKIEEIIKGKVTEYESQRTKPNRIILSGSSSEQIRQDTFTKSVGVWTNPLKRIIPDFYKDYVKLFIASPNKPLPLLNFDMCFGAFVFTHEHKNFSFFRNKFSQTNKPSFSYPKIPLPKKEILLFISSFILSFLFFLLVSKLNIASFVQNNIKVSPTPAPPSLPTPTPTPIIQKESLKIKILNGSGTRGKASEVKNILKTQNYQEILTGNADSFDYEGTILRMRKDQVFLGETIKKDLQNYVSASISADLDEKEAADIIIIIGKDFK